MAHLKRLILTLFFGLAFLQYGYAQHLHLKIQAGVDTTDVVMKQVIRVWRAYLASDPDSVYNNPYWNEKEKKKYLVFDFLRSGYLKTKIYSGYQPVLLAVTPRENHYYQIKTAFLSQHGTVLCVANVYAKKVNGQYELFNALPINTRNWETQTVGTITYHFKEGYPFNRKDAERMNHFAKILQGMFHMKPSPVDYYIGKNLDELMRLDGLEIFQGMGNPFTVSGYSDVFNQIIFSGGGGEYYPHELTHIYINPLFPDANNIFLEGLAIYYGGSLGHPLQWHLNRLNNYLHTHPKINLNNLFLFNYMDNYTNPLTTIGGLLSKLAFKKGGVAVMRKLLSSGRSHADFYTAIKKVFGVDRSRLNEFLRHKIDIVATGKNNPFIQK